MGWGFRLIVKRGTTQADRHRRGARCHRPANTAGCRFMAISLHVACPTSLTCGRGRVGLHMRDEKVCIP